MSKLKKWKTLLRGFLMDVHLWPKPKLSHYPQWDEAIVHEDGTIEIRPMKD